MHEACEDCRATSNAGAKKCRACYAAWQRLVWRDLPRERERLENACKRLRGYAPEARKRIAGVGVEFVRAQRDPGHGGDGNTHPLRGPDAELYADVKRVLEGPYGGSMEIVLTGYWSTPTDDGGKSSKNYRGSTT